MMHAPSTRLTYIFLGLLVILTLALIIAAALTNHGVLIDNSPQQILHGAP